MITHSTPPDEKYFDDLVEVFKLQIEMGIACRNTHEIEYCDAYGNLRVSHVFIDPTDDNTITVTSQSTCNVRKLLIDLHDEPARLLHMIFTEVAG